MSSRSQLKRQAEAALRHWNRLYPTGSRVVLLLGPKAYETATTGAARLQGDHAVVVPIRPVAVGDFLVCIAPLDDLRTLITIQENAP